MSATIYAGPGKLYFNGVAIQANDTNGRIIARTQQEADPVAVSMYGRVGYVQGNVVETIEVTPFDNWGLLKTLFPAYLGVSAGTQAGALAIGTRPHNPGGAADAAAKIYTPDGRLYTFPRCAVIKHPDIHLGANRPLFGAMQLTNIIATGVAMGSSGAFHSVTESGALDPGGAFITSDVDRGAWTAAWGTAAGFGGDGGAAMEAEDGFTIVTSVKYSPLVVQKLVRAFKLDEVHFMVKGRLFGPTHTQITTMTGINNSRVLGNYIPTGNAADLTLTGPNAKTVTLRNADLVGTGFEFGGTELGTGETGFVSGITFTSGTPGPLLIFST